MQECRDEKAGQIPPNGKHACDGVYIAEKAAPLNGEDGGRNRKTLQPMREVAGIIAIDEARASFTQSPE